MNARHGHQLVTRNRRQIVTTDGRTILARPCCRPGRCAPAVGVRCCLSARCDCNWPADVATFQGFAPAAPPTHWSDHLGKALWAFGITAGLGVCAGGVWLVATITRAIATAVSAVGAWVAGIGGGGVLLGLAIAAVVLFGRRGVTVTTTTTTKIR
jgi:hypothetical protein